MSHGPLGLHGPCLMLGLLHEGVNDLLLYLALAAKGPDDGGLLGHSQRIIKCRNRQLSSPERAVSGEEGQLFPFRNLFQKCPDLSGNAVRLHGEPAENDIIGIQISGIRYGCNFLFGLFNAIINGMRQFFRVSGLRVVRDKGLHILFLHTMILSFFT